MAEGGRLRAAGGMGADWGAETPCLDRWLPISIAPLVACLYDPVFGLRRLLEKCNNLVTL
jgi:hypothetical protein